MWQPLMAVVVAAIAMPGAALACQFDVDCGVGSTCTTRAIPSQEKRP